MSLYINEQEFQSFHFIGLFGIGMSAIAQYLAPDCTISGSDRGSGTPEGAVVETILKKQNIAVFSQDGSGISESCDAVVLSTAIEDTNPDVVKAKELGIPLLHRSEVLAAIVNTKKTISVTGTSGKSSVSAMIYAILASAGTSPSYIGGANIHALKNDTALGNASRGESDILIIEADESDGSVVRYYPDTTLILNVSKDHKSEEEVIALMEQASKQSKHTVFNGMDPLLNSLEGTTFGLDKTLDQYATNIKQSAQGARFTIGEVDFSLPFPGEHVVLNTLAAVATSLPFGVTLAQCSKALSTYKGIERRFDRYSCGEVTLVDDYAHNPEKVKAAIQAARAIGKKMTVLFQPHGFGPLRFLFDDFREAFEDAIEESERLILLPVYYAGGTVNREIDATTLAEALQTVDVIAPEHRDEAVGFIPKECDTILLLGARDPSLPTFGKELLNDFCKDTHGNE